MGKKTWGGSSFLLTSALSLSLVFCGCADPLAGSDKKPNIDILQGSTSLPNGTGAYGFADTSVGSSTDAVFTIQNTGTSNLDLKLAKSTNGGVDWALSTVETSGSIGDHNSMTISGGVLYLSYELTNTNTRLRFAKSPDGGSTWSFATVDSNNYTGNSTSIAVDGAKVYIGEVETDADDLKFAKSVDGGLTW